MRYSRVRAIFAFFLTSLLIVQAGCGDTTPAIPSPTASGKSQATTVPSQTKNLPTAGSTLSPAVSGTGRSPLDPLPQPLAASSEQGTSAARLVERILAGGDESEPALLAALKASGFTVRDHDGSTVVKPAQPVHGIAFDAWEVNALGRFARERKAVTVPLDNFAEVLASPLPELSDAPVADFLLEGILTHASDPDSALHFWALTIVELGKQAQLHEPYDLLQGVDAREVNLDSLQMALIGKALAGDLVAFANSDKVGKRQGWQFPSLPARTAYAQPAPCQFDGVQGEVMDWAAFGLTTGFGSLIGYLADSGIDAADKIGKVTGFTNLILAYTKMILTQAAFEMEFMLDGGEPLIRTKDLSPKTGDRQMLLALTKLDVNQNASWINCFRPVLNAMGLDFNADANGPIKGAAVSWVGNEGFNQAAEVLHGGTPHIVQFVTDGTGRIQESGGGTGYNQTTKQLTDDQGIARIYVEGVGQKTDLGKDPKPIERHASGAANVVLKPANLYRDLKDGAMTASGGLSGLATMPIEMLNRTRWTFGGIFSFEVKDWRKNVGGWSGTVTFSHNIQSTRGMFGEPWTGQFGKKVETKRQTEVAFKFSNGIGTWSATEHSNLNESGDCAWMPKTTEFSGSGTGEAVLEIDGEEPPQLDGEYASVSVHDNGIGVTGVIIQGFTSGAERTCEGPRSLNSDDTMEYYPLGEVNGSIEIEGKDRLRGSLTSPISTPTERGTETVTWDLTRE